MTKRTSLTRGLCLLLALLMTGALSACALPGGAPPEVSAPDPEHVLSRYLVSIEDEPDTVDFQCTTIYYTIAQNVFDRLVEMKSNAKGQAVIQPSLAERWTVSEDRCRYTFHLREGVRFSNGSALTAEDVAYTFTRLLTHPDSCNRDIVDNVVGAGKLERGESESLEGLTVLGELDFSVTLEQPFEAFLACLSMPGASILDAETTEEAGDRFGKDPAWTIGTGPFILQSWEPGRGMILTANADCWSGPPCGEGLDLRFITDPAEIRQLFEKGVLDVLNLDDVGRAAEFFLHGDIYKDRLFRVRRISIVYIALNEAIAPLDDVRVRKALQYSLDQELLLDAAYGGNGTQENGIMPHGLSGFNPDLPVIPYDLDEARALLAEAGLEEGFTLPFCVSSSSSLSELSMIRAAADMWAGIGVTVEIRVLDDGEFMRLRKSGQLPCYSATWTADFNDPDNFFYTFFGNEENTRFRSLNYPREEIMARVRGARSIADPDERIAEYRALEEIIAQEDAAWIPLYSRQYVYVVSERLRGICASWNGSVKNEYRSMSVADTHEA